MRNLTQEQFQQLKKLARVLIVTAKPVEAEAVRAVMERKPLATDLIPQYMEYRFGYFGAFLAVHLSCGEGGLNTVAAVAQALNDLRTPGEANSFYVLMPGIACGLRRSADDDTRIAAEQLRRYLKPNAPYPLAAGLKRELRALLDTGETHFALPQFLTPEARDLSPGSGQRIGDVMVAEQIWDYDYVRMSPDGTERRGIPFHAVRSRVDLLMAHAREWQRTAPEADYHARRCQVHTGLILSGSKLVDHHGFREQLRREFKNAIGLEMEGHGLGTSVLAYTGREQEGQAWFLFAKGICDWGVGKTDDWQQRAAAASTGLLHHCLSNHTFFDSFLQPADEDAVELVLRQRETSPGVRKRSYSLSREGSEAGLEARIGFDLRRHFSEPDTGRNVYREQDDYCHWARRVLGGDTRILVVNGPSGRGKSTFCLQMRREMLREDPRSVHFWLDCMYHAPDPQAAVLPQLFAKDEKLGREVAFMGALKSDALFPPANGMFGPEAPPIVVYLDDGDCWIAELGDQGSALRRLLGAYHADSAFRFVITSRNPLLAGEIERFLGRATGLVAETGSRDENADPDLSRLHPAHVEALFRSPTSFDGLFAGVWEAGPDLLAAVLRGLAASSRVVEARPGGASAAGVDPLELSLLVQLLRAEGGSSPEARAACLRRLVGVETAAAGEFRSGEQFRQLLFNARYANLPVAARELALALAVLNDPRYSYSYPATEDALRAITGWSDTEFQRTLAILSPRGADRTLGATGNEILAPGELRFALDPIRDHFYEHGGGTGRAAQWVRLREVYHRRAAEYYDPALPGPGGQPDDAAWHYMAVADYRNADRCIDLAASLAEDENRYAQANVLRTRMCELLEPAAAAAEPADLWAKHRAELAHILYQQGYNISYEEAFELSREVVSGYHDDPYDPIPPEGAHANIQATLLAKLVMAAIDFEMPYERSDRSIDDLIDDVGSLLNELKATEDDLGQELLEANGLTLLGILHNRRAEFAEALKYYEDSAARWEGLLQDTAGVKGDELDLLRAVSSQARSLLLLGRAPEGLERLNAFIRRFPELFRLAPGTTGTASRFYSQDKAFALVNREQCFMVLNHIQRLPSLQNAPRHAFYRQPLRGVVRPGDWPAALPTAAKCVDEEWIETYMDTLAGARRFYEGDFEGAREVFAYCAASFRRQDEERDERFLRVNEAFSRLFAQVGEHWRLGEADPLVRGTGLLREALCGLVDAAALVADEPIVRGAVTHALSRLRGEDIPGAAVGYSAWVERLTEMRADRKFASGLASLIDAEGRPQESAFAAAAAEFARCFRPVIDNDPPWKVAAPEASGGVTGRPEHLRWLPVIVMRGALILRPKPISSWRVPAHAT